jgi:undecaprenyl diphosphate synthase
MKKQNNLKVPNHLGIILDGNRRWAKERKMSPMAGHKKGAEAARKIIEAADDKGIKILTLFVFSTENWKRPKRETDYLMGLLKKVLSESRKGADKRGLIIRVIGQKDRLPKALQKEILFTEKETENNKGMVVNFALSYGGRAEIIQAIKNIIKKKIPVDEINEDRIRENLWTTDVDLVIRTGKQLRISNFLIWQSAYSELYFSPKYWPDFAEKDLNEALSDYDKRQRSFGG